MKLFYNLTTTIILTRDNSCCILELLHFVIKLWVKNIMKSLYDTCFNENFTFLHKIVTKIIIKIQKKRTFFLVCSKK